ncbi:MAG: NAD(P)-binding protein [Pseudomonadota bacterium]
MLRESAVKQKIAIIGGGVGAITAAYSITQTPNWSDKYEITIYQLGWRLGGKGASGRNAKHGQRIQEHGLHVWAGFYDNAFRCMTACYEQLVSLGLRDANAPLGTVDAAFKPPSHLFLAERVPTTDSEPDTWRPWVIDLPSNTTVPGSETKVPGPFAMFLRILEIIATFIKDGEFNEPGGGQFGFHLPKDLDQPYQKILAQAKGMSSDPTKHTADQLNILADLIADAQNVVHALETPAAIQNDPVRRGLYLADIVLAYMHGVVTSDTFVSGYDILDDWEFSDWLRLNGASDAALASVPIRGCYDFVFGYDRGNSNTKGDSGAGTSLRAMTRLLFTYSGAIFHKMQAGMGDTIFGPYYQVLKKLGVKFEFFNAARDFHLSDDKTKIARISMVRQAEVIGGDYNPLVEVQGLPCWPSEPDWSQLVDGAHYRDKGIDFECEKSPPTGTHFTLEAGKDFDQVILGASIGSLPYMTGELIKASERWSRMLSEVKTVGTQAAQFWLTKTTEELGWGKLVAEHNNNRLAIPDVPMRTVITGFEEPLDTWADMSHLLGREDWPEPGPQNIAYFCSPAEDGETLEQFDHKVSKWMNKNLPSLWPNASDGKGGFDTSVLYDGFENQYTRVNMYGSERYVLSVTGSVFHRLPPSESGFANLVLAGDWTRCGINAGCVEAATISGIAAASAVTGETLLNVGAEDVPRVQTTEDQAMYLSNSISGAHWPLTPFFARGEMSGWFFFYDMPWDQVAALLPPGVTLGRSSRSKPGHHPVGMSFCQYQNVRGSFLPDCLAMKPYGEATFAIPYTNTAATGRASLLYPRKLYVNSTSAIFAGKFFYAMNKSDAEINVENTHFSVTDSTGLNIDAQFEQQSGPVAASDHPAQGAILDLLNTTFVTRKSSGGLLYNAFNLEINRAYLAPVSGQVTSHDPHSGGFPAADLSLRPLEQSAPRGLPGAFRIWCSWSMTNPLDSKWVREATEARHWIRATY